MSEPFVIPSPIKGPFVLGPGSMRQAGVPEGTVSREEFKSEIFPGTVRDVFVYAPVQYTPEKPAAVMVFQDGWKYANPEGPFRATVVMDNLIHQGKMPVTIGVFVNPGVFPVAGEGREPVLNRSFEYDSLGNQYTRFLLQEIMPLLEGRYKLSADPVMRAMCGASSGGICAWTVAWERPDVFGKVLSHIGSFTNIRGGHVYPALIRSTAKRPIRVYLQGGSNDVDNYAGCWALANLQMAASLNYMGYDYRLEYGDGVHSSEHGGATLPAAMEWLWRAADGASK
jgi:enterochelin esterase-like enzyme